MVVDRSERRCLLCEEAFRGRAFLCRDCAAQFRGQVVPASVRQRFYEAVDEMYPDWSNTFGHYNPPLGLMGELERLPRQFDLLEIGAGGGFTLEAVKRLGFNNIAGLDVTATSLRAMRARLLGVPLVAADAESLPFAAQSFDVLLSSDVIEHLPDLDQHLAEARRVLRLGGRYLVKTPNRQPAELYYRASGLYDAYFWHPSMQSPGELRHSLGRHGFTCQFLPTPRLTEAQCRKIPLRQLRPLARRAPVGWLPAALRVHLEVVAIRVR